MATNAAHARLPDATPPSSAQETVGLGAMLLRQGLVPPHDMMQALAQQGRRRGRLADILLRRGAISEVALGQALSRQWRADQINLSAQPADPRLIDKVGAVTCLRCGIIPWRKQGDITIVATAYPQEFTQHRSTLEQLLGPIAMALASAGQIEAAILATRGRQLDHRARHRVANNESCRNWGSARMAHWSLFVLVALIVTVWLAPLAVAYALTFWAVLTLFLATVLKTGAAIAALRRPPPEEPAPLIGPLPVVSVLVALYHEGNIAPRLIRRLSRLDYPRELLDILLVVEEDDHITRAALECSLLPPWMRVIVAPDSRLKTKPRALNFALDACRGSIVGIYDAEDAPEADQIRKVVDRFHHRDRKVACLQGVLDFYNPRSNWLSRCFTMEYATWFRIILPGMERLGFAIPLGGTTLFFRRDVLEELGGWDAHNVTEDADLGIRLARHGYRTELISTTTFEEANCRTLPWIRQRSRWLKGYMVTYAVHMRAPRLLLRQFGWWKFLGFQVFFLTTLSQFLLAPVLWTFWLVPLGLSHPVVDALPPLLHLAMMGTFLFTEAVLLVVTLVAMRLTPNRMNPIWAPILHFYFPLGALASYKAAWELLVRPFWWDKTSHGHADPPD